MGSDRNETPSGDPAKKPGMVCPSCGAQEYRKYDTQHGKGAVFRVMRCSRCGFHEEHTVVPQ